MTRWRAKLARTRGFFVVDDGVYVKLRFDGAITQRLRAGAPSHVIYVDSLSKPDGPVPGYEALLRRDAETIVAGLAGAKQ